MKHHLLAILEAGIYQEIICLALWFLGFSYLDRRTHTAAMLLAIVIDKKIAVAIRRSLRKAKDEN